MVDKLKIQIADQFPFLDNKKLLLATSGGLDSMVMAHLFQQLHHDIALAHCNFQLRGVESFGDQKFVQDFADTNKIPVYVTQFDTLAFAKDYKLSTQVAARDLRYNWFYELLESENFDYILTAHHADDNIETFLINLSRGTGLEGLTGIPAENGNIIRPLLAFSRDEIAQYAHDHGIEWREDSSNASEKYLRNKIRHDLVPLLKELNPQFISSFQKTQSYLQQSEAMVEDASIMVYQQVVRQEEDEIYIDLKQLLRLPNYKSYLYQWLKEFQFSAWDDVYNLVDSLSGKQVYSSNFRLIKDRDFLILSPINFEEQQQEYLISQGVQDVKIPLKLSFCKVNDISVSANTAIFVDEDKLDYPLILRKWQEGDVFQPFGMEGKSKKLSKFFKDEKFSLLEKENCWILCSGEAVVWIVGYRQDERFKIQSTTQNILKIDLQ
ncbi:tRNA lysidine(34) synthetase TilS [Flavobacterium muglaense]|uniref:tRNA(Ile)-lysidine synthase n=1 Tax=Flavobacterium muglaense TaxID=2764716 RepID=A0A923MX44_9FLAO|nr:tRNA lysidine(34) synthetase TilS [Flavobacterium muglaense]MBC5836756.1 tRNA lysidine(34) synthetase TilS [Flavobacterium muglaense]MBC5843294.1 tRNA lysidine(34) synthetase TilS [Flavobacterium muglaense]